MPTMPTPTTTPRTPWGSCRSDATRLHPRLAWHLLTDAQVDCLYLADRSFCRIVFTQRQVAARFGVATSTVNEHLRAARRRLQAAGKAAALAPDNEIATGSRVACASCDTPWMTCTECIERTFFQPPTTFLRVRNRLRAMPTDRVAAGKELPHSEDVSAPAHGRQTKLGRNPDYRAADPYKVPL